jgi:DMSO/TMAO reductase YedYZ molybdopterin-dependent catalytic subunit
MAALMATGAPAQTLTLLGLEGNRRVLALAELQALPQQQYRDSGSNGVHVFRGPALRELLTLVGAPEGRALRGANMQLVVVAEASDNYRVAYSLAELDAQFGARHALVALTQDGAALPPNEGPLRIVMPGESHRARWIRQLTTLRVVRAGG